MRLAKTGLSACLFFLVTFPAIAAAENKALSTYFPPTEEKGGWRTLLPDSGDPESGQKAKIREMAGVDWDKLEEAWRHNASAPGATGLVVIRKGHVVGEWYRDCDPSKSFNIYSSSKAYTSMAFGLILADFGAGPLPALHRRGRLIHSVSNPLAKRVQRTDEQREPTQSSPVAGSGRRCHAGGGHEWLPGERSGEAPTSRGGDYRVHVPQSCARPSGEFS